MNGIDEFINPKSMITPGIIGGTIMFITNSLCCQFTIPPKWVGLFLSFLFGLLVLKAEAIPRWQRGVYYVVNSLIIFSVAFGTANFASGVERDAERTRVTGYLQQQKTSVVRSPVNQGLFAKLRDPSIIPAVLEISPNLQLDVIKVQAGPSRGRDLERQLQESRRQQQADQARIRRLEDQLRRAHREPPPHPPAKKAKEQKGQFFKTW
jgi:hypothetical protein